VHAVLYYSVSGYCWKPNMYIAQMFTLLQQLQYLAASRHAKWMRTIRPNGDHWWMIFGTLHRLVAIRFTCDELPSFYQCTVMDMVFWNVILDVPDAIASVHRIISYFHHQVIMIWSNCPDDLSCIHWPNTVYSIYMVVTVYILTNHSLTQSITKYIGPMRSKAEVTWGG